MGWSKLCRFENEGGMGLQDLKLFSLGFGLAEIFSLFVILVYFSYYLWVLLYFLILFISLIVLFNFFFSILLIKSFQLQVVLKRTINLTFLWRQCWRIVHNQNSLLFRVLKSYILSNYFSWNTNLIKCILDGVWSQEITFAFDN